MSDDDTLRYTNWRYRVEARQDTDNCKKKVVQNYTVLVTQCL
jgi:hypothetical protein